MLEEDNRVYGSQISVLAIIASITFKVVMLPKYMTEVAGNMAFVSVAIMMLFDVLGYLLISYVIKRVNVMKINNKLMMVPIMLSVFIMSSARMVVLGGETIAYINGTLFDQGKIAFVLLALIPLLAYMVFKGGNNIARLSQIVFWLILVSVVFTIILARPQLDLGQLFPMFSDGITPVLSGCNDHYLWFGDYLPFMFLQIIPTRTKSGKKRRNTFPLVLMVIYVLAVVFFSLFTAVYGETGSLVMFAFNRIAIFNRISQLIGPTNFPAVITWLLMAIIKLSLLLYAMTMSLTYIVRRKWLALLISCGIMAISLGVIWTSVEAVYQFGSGGIKYLAAAVQYGVPIALALYVKIKHRSSNNSLNGDEGLSAIKPELIAEVTNENENIRA